MAKSSTKVILAGLAGLAVGITVGVLIAPCKGSKTRKRLKKRISDLEEVFQEGDISEKIDSLKSIFTQEKEKPAGNEPPGDDSGNPDDDPNS